MKRLIDGGKCAEEFEMRLHVMFELGDERDSWLNKLLLWQARQV